MEPTVPAPLGVRSDEWLATYLGLIWDAHFSDVPWVDTIDIRFGRPWKTVLGFITLEDVEDVGQICFIRINWLMQLSQVPESVVELIIAEEIVHYTHGFGSTLPRKYRYPHKGSVVPKELRSRGMGHLLTPCSAWIDKEWDLL